MGSASGNIMEYGAHRNGVVTKAAGAAFHGSGKRAPVIGSGNSVSL
jgi:hypothetical protein